MAHGYTVGLGLIAAHHASDDHCDRNLGPCHDPAVVGPLIAIGIGTIGLGVGVWYQFHPHPIDENAAKSLADAYNQGLRRQLGLPVASRRPLLRGVRLAPYVAAHQGGLGLSARF
jgi:hypothetical protein